MLKISEKISESGVALAEALLHVSVSREAKHAYLALSRIENGEAYFARTTLKAQASTLAASHCAITTRGSPEPRLNCASLNFTDHDSHQPLSRT